MRLCLPPWRHTCVVFFFFLNDPAPPEIYTLSQHDALPIFPRPVPFFFPLFLPLPPLPRSLLRRAHWPSFFGITSSQRFESRTDRKSTRLNSSHANISYAVFCLKKKKTNYFQSTYHYTYKI